MSLFGLLTFPSDVVAEIYSSFALPLRQHFEAIGDGSAGPVLAASAPAT